MDEIAGSEASRIVLVNLHSSCNAGDDALTREALSQLGEQFPQASFTLAMNDPASHTGKGQALGSFTTWLKPIVVNAASQQWQWKAFPGLIVQSLVAVAGYRFSGRPWYLLVSAERQALLDSYFEADMVISAAGNFLYTSGILGLPFLLSLYAIFYAQLAGKPTYTLPQTLGPIRRRHERFLARHVLSKVRLVLIRDPISQEVWETWGIRGSRWALLADLAFAHSAETDGQKGSALLEEYGVRASDQLPRLGVTLIQWGSQSRSFERQAHYENAMQAAVRDFVVHHDGQVILFSQVQGPTAAEDDREAARRVFGQLGDLADRVVLIDRPVPGSVLKAAYGQVDLFLGTRLHSNIFALAERVPVVAIGYQYKTRGIMRMLDLEQWVLDIEHVNDDNLVQLLRRAWIERERTRAHIDAMLPKVREQACRAGALIAADYRSLGDGASKG